MIPARHPYEAHYKHEHEGRTVFSSKPVIAWGDDGHALVVDERTGRLVPADNGRTFTGVGEGRFPVVAAIPGGGWRTAYREDDGTLSIDPLVAWIVRSDGTMTAIDTDSHGDCDEAPSISNFAHLLAPGEEPPERP